MGTGYMGADTTDHGFERRKDSPASASSADPAVPDVDTDETLESTLDSDAADADLADADYLEVDDPDVAQPASATSTHRKRPSAPLRAELPPTTGAISIERIEAPASHDVYDYDTDHRGIEPVPALHDDAAQPRRRDRRNEHEHRNGRGTRDHYEDHDQNQDYEPRRARRRERRRGRAGWIAATFIFFLLFGSAATLDWYLWNTTQEWEAHSTRLTQANYDLGARLAAEQQTTMQLGSEIDLLTQQLATSNQTVTDLSAEKAGAVDQSAIRQQEIEALEDTLSSAGRVANSLHRCIDEQQQLAEYLRNAEDYEPEDLEAFTTTVNELCSAAEQANDRLQEALNQ